MSEYRLTPDGVQARALEKEEFSMLALARARMMQVRAPRLMDTPYDRLYVAALDGTGNSQFRDPEINHTVVASMANMLRGLDEQRIAVHYVEGVGTQSSWFQRAWDGAMADTLEARAEVAYLGFCRQAAKWLAEDPNARIHLVGIGFSRGAETVALLERLVHERGIRDPDGAVARYDDDGILTSITWADRPLLVPPGQTVQVAFLVDPVGTGAYDVDRGLRASNVSAVQITSRDEGRGHFTSTAHVPPGLSDQGRMANIVVPGAHSDLGRTYLLDGIGRMVENFGIDYVNTLLGGDRLAKVPEPYDPRLYAVHRSEQHLFGLWPDGHHRERGERIVHTKLGPACPPLPAPCMRDAVDSALAAGLAFDYVGNGRLPGGSDAKMDLAMQAVRDMYQRDSGLVDRLVTDTRIPLRAELLDKARDLDAAFGQLAGSAARNDLPGMRLATEMYRATPLGRIFEVASLGRALWDELGPDRSWQADRNGAAAHESPPATHRPALPPVAISP